MGHVALRLLLMCWQTKRTRGTWALASILDTPLRTCGTWASVSVLGTPLRTHGAWALCMGGGHPQGTISAWVALRVSHAHATLWVMVLDRRFFGPRILNIIICFINIIIFIIIHMVNKIINKFERKYYY